MSDTKKIRTRKESITELDEILAIGSHQTMLECMEVFFDKEQLSKFVDYVREEVYGY